MLHVLGIDHIVLRVSDRERALVFYCGVLGMAIEREQPELGLTQLRAGRSLIDLITIDGALGRRSSSPPGVPGSSVDHIALEVMPLDEAVHAHLGQHGIDVIEAGPRYGARGSGPSLYVRDPDGNKISTDHNSHSLTSRAARARICSVLNRGSVSPNFRTRL